MGAIQVACQGILGGQTMSKTDFRLWLTSHLALAFAFFWWCLDSKIGMFSNVFLAIGLAIAALIPAGGGKEDGK